MIPSVKALTAGVLIAVTQIDPTPVDQQRAEMYFREAKELCDRDNGRLWGVSLCGPMVFADARTRTIARAAAFNWIRKCPDRMGGDTLGRLRLGVHSC